MMYKFVIGLVLILLSCTKHDEVACTMEFRSVQIKIIGEELSDFYTVRLSTNDTLQFEHFFTPNEGYYTVLDDSFQSQLQGKKEQFRFIGKINNDIVVDELFMIEADKCHINYVSGKLEVVL